MNIQQKYIKRCLELAKNGFGFTYPNPMVGSVIVYKGRIIGEGWHQKAGEPHAEVNAINAVKDKSLLKNATLYVNLEPCSHYGKTPPCADLIVKYQIPNVVIGALDTNPKVSGNGILHLINNGCEVVVGILEQECLELNKRFYTFHNSKRPYIILKWAASADGFIAKKQTKAQEREPFFITNNQSLQLVHMWRTQEEAILVGTNTAVTDNPKLNARHSVGQNPIRVVLDRLLRIPKKSHLFDESVQTIVITDSKSDLPQNETNLIFETIDFSKNIPKQICKVLYKYQIQSVIIEGGMLTLQSFINSNLWDEARIFKSKINLLDGVKAPQISGTLINTQKILNDELSIFKR